MRKFDEAKNPRDARRLLRCAQSPCERVCDRSALQGGWRRGHHESSSLPHLRCCTVSASRSSPMKSLALCARSASPPLMATTPLAGAKTGDRITRHNALRKRWLRASPIKACSRQCSRSKASSLLCSAPGRRPLGDVTIQNWCDGKGPAIDVAVTSPFSAQHPANQPPCEYYYAEQYKHGKYTRKGLQGLQLFVLGQLCGKLLVL